MMRFPRVLLAALCLLLLWSCGKESRDPCLQPRTMAMRVHTYHHADTGAAIVDTLLPNPILVPLTGKAQLFYYGGQKRISAFGLTLSNLADSSRWIIQPDSAVRLADTLTIYYERQLRFLSNACGYTYFYNLQRLAYTRHALDSAIIAHADVTTDVNIEHLRLYY